jgi:hypothetical protein
MVTMEYDSTTTGIHTLYWSIVLYQRVLYVHTERQVLVQGYHGTQSGTVYCISIGFWSGLWVLGTSMKLV